MTMQSSQKQYPAMHSSKTIKTSIISNSNVSGKPSLKDNSVGKKSQVYFADKCIASPKRSLSPAKSLKLKSYRKFDFMGIQKIN